MAPAAAVPVVTTCVGFGVDELETEADVEVEESSDVVDDDEDVDEEEKGDAMLSSDFDLSCAERELPLSCKLLF